MRFLWHIGLKITVYLQSGTSPEFLLASVGNPVCRVHISAFLKQAISSFGTRLSCCEYPSWCITFPILCHIWNGDKNSHCFLWLKEQNHLKKSTVLILILIYFKNSPFTFENCGLKNRLLSPDGWFG